jgi:hypothetical protein
VPETFATVLERGLGRTICREFYFPCARKLWGLDPEELALTTAQRRVSSSSIGKMIRKVFKQIPCFEPEGAGRFYYPRRKFGARFTVLERVGRGIRAVRYGMILIYLGLDQDRFSGTDAYYFPDPGCRRLLGWMEQASLPKSARVARAVTRRLRQAYPVYRRGYEENFDKMDRWLGEIAVGCLSPDGKFDRARWADHRKEFETHVVED